MNTYRIEANDAHIGEYTASGGEEALDAYAQDAGYEDYVEQAREYGDFAHWAQIDTDAICAALPVACFQDSYGDGVAVVNGKSYPDWQSVASILGKNVWEFDVD